MFVFEKDGALNIQFTDTQIPQTEDDVVLAKVDDKTSINIQGREYGAVVSNSNNASETAENVTEV